MNIKKVLTLTQEEIDMVIGCGKLFRDIENGLSTGAIDEVEPNTANLINALGRVSNEISEKVSQQLPNTDHSEVAE